MNLYPFPAFKGATIRAKVEIILCHFFWSTVAVYSRERCKKRHTANLLYEDKFWSPERANLLIKSSHNQSSKQRFLLISLVLQMYIVRVRGKKDAKQNTSKIKTGGEGGSSS